MVNSDLTAVVTSKSLQTIDDMVKIFDGQTGKIGLGKVHFRFNFKQLIVKANKRTFGTLRDEYEHLKRIYEGKSHVKIEHYDKILGKSHFTFISCRSPIR